VSPLHAYGVHVWLVEVDGPVDLTDPAHQALLMLLGHQSQREVLRARRRTTAAMRAQARTQGRHLGGRPAGRKPTHRWNPREQWVISTAIVHPPLVSDAVFARVQRVSVAGRR
jgi:DNA invertase Pin-like site-specific DNA recombinase